MTKSNIVIVGMMGINKKDVGKELAERLSIHHCDSDELLEYEYGSIAYIIDWFEEEGYRKYEKRAIKQVCSYENTVISTGEGVLLLESNCQIIKSTATVVWLKTDLGSSFGNILYKQKAMLPKGDFDEYQSLYAKYKQGYKEYSDIVVDVHLRSIDDIVNEIIDKLVELYNA